MVEKESYYITLIRYIEANALRAKLVRHAKEWVEYVNALMKQEELHNNNNIRNSVNRQSPLGNEKWQVETATKYGMLSTLNQRG